MRCPRCEFESPSEEECLKCGIVFAKWLQLLDQEDREIAEEEAAQARAEEAKAAAPPRLSLALPPNQRELETLLRSLGRLLESGISAIESLDIVTSTLSSRLGAAMQDLREGLLAGKKLSTAMEAHTGLFDRRLIAEVRTGERTGHLFEAFERAADRLEAKRKFKRAIFRKQFMLLFTLVMGIFLLPIPAIFFGSGGSYWAQVLIPLGILAGGYFLLPHAIRLLLRHTVVGRWVKWLAWHASWPATIYVTWIRSHFLEDLAIHIDTGHSMGQAIDFVIDVTEDPVVKERLNASLERGDLDRSLASVLLAAQVVDRIDQVQVTTGERSGTIVAALHHLASAYRERFDRGLQVLLGVLQGMLVLAVLATLAISTYQAASATKAKMNEVQKVYEGEMEKLFRDLDGAGLGDNPLRPEFRPLNP